jgi:hypothetical protein
MTKPKHIECHTAFVIAGCESEEALASAHEYVQFRVRSTLELDNAQQALASISKLHQEACKELARRAAVIRTLRLRVCVLTLLLIIVGGFAWHRA